MGYRVDVTIQGEQSATLNYATNCGDVAAIACAAQALSGQIDPDFPTVVTEIRITLNPA